MKDRELLDGWCQTVQALSPAAQPLDVDATGRDLLTRWSEPHRHYHTAQHLSEMLRALDELSTPNGGRVGRSASEGHPDGGRVGRSASGGRIEVPSPLPAHERHIAVIAAWLHDAVYDVNAAAGDSERASARLARNMLASLRFDASDIQTVQALILLTIDHGTALPGPLADAFTDSDLAILAAPATRFDEYCAQVRAEYAHVPDATYATARGAILRDLVDRPDVYRTAHAGAVWTGRARENVAAELARLGARLGE